MKINFDFYTSSVTDAATAFTMACDSSDDVTLSRRDWGTRQYNVCGAIDHRSMEPLFSFFEANGFFEDAG